MPLPTYFLSISFFFHLYPSFTLLQIHGLSNISTHSQINFIHSSTCTWGHIWCQPRHTTLLMPGSHLLPSPGWQSRCDLSYLLYCLLIRAISFPPLLILFHSLPLHLIPFPPCPLTLYLSHLSHPPPLFLSPPFPLTFFPTAAPHTPLVAAASLLKVQTWLVLLLW